MTDPEATVTNVARDNANVDVQAAVVHGDINHFTIAPDASPQEKFEKGVNLLHSDVPSRALRLIDAAVDEGYHTNKVFFYWLLALVSGRTWNELSDEEAAMLRNRHNIIRLVGDDCWADGVETVDRLLDFARKPDTDLPVLLEDFDKLRSGQRALILKHLELFLDGPLQDQMWSRAMARAEQEQMARDRRERVWKFFHPTPIGPRHRAPRPAVVSATTRAQALMGTAVFILLSIHIGYLLAQAGRLLPLLTSLLCLPVGYFGARNAVEWRFRVVRLLAKEEEYRTPQRRSPAPSGGFAKKIDESFDRYFRKYVPSGMDRQMWLAETAGILRSLRDEIVWLYREERTGADRVAWLVRHRVTEVKTRREKGTLWNYRTELQTPFATKTRAIFGLAAGVGAGIWAVSDAAPASPLSAARSIALMLAAGYLAARAWLHIVLEYRRADADESERQRVWEGDKAAYDRWCAKLADRPKDEEMAAWLDCDRKALLNEALTHYRLPMSDVIAYAFIEAPATTTKRARIRNGPWRYTKYTLRVFLLTADGVRQLAVRLHFEQGTFHDRHRANYRYEAVAAVRVHHTDDDERTFELALVNGQDIKVQVTGPGMEELRDGEKPGEVSEVTLDSAGLHHTLHVLEGIAAEGKNWIARENQRAQARAGSLTAATQDPGTWPRTPDGDPATPLTR